MINLIAIGSLSVLGLYAAMGDGMILGWLRGLFERATDNRLLKHIRPALYECPICMASIWGTVFWLAITYTDQVWYQQFNQLWIVYTFAVAGLNYIAINIINRDE